MSEYQYIINKINNAEIIDSPFPHYEINNFLSDEHLNLILNDKQIHFENQTNIDELYNKLIKNKFDVQPFPGSLKNFNEYKLHLNNLDKFSSKNPVEGIGITFRLKKYNNNKIKNLMNFLNSNLFHNTLRNKFSIKDETTIISAIQKNLSGYELSPHPDIRNKCLTYLLNINNNDDMKNKNNNTILSEFKNEYKYIEKFWLENIDYDRAWVPWEWCNKIKYINKNNSFLLFKPSSSPASLHSVKLNYDHLKCQRTQIYGNLMYKNKTNYIVSRYKDLL